MCVSLVVPKKARRFNATIDLIDLFFGRLNRIDLMRVSGMRGGRAEFHSTSIKDIFFRFQSLYMALLGKPLGKTLL